jgi:broad specificity phosphatase PhoE
VKLLLIRHGESVGNAEGVIQGQAEYPLTERGRRQAEATAIHLKTIALSGLYASPLIRAFDTARIVGRYQGIEPVPLIDVQEYHFGEGTGLPFSEWRRRSSVPADSGDPQHTVTPLYPGEEGREAFRDRVLAAMWDLCERHQEDDTIAVVAHAGPIAVFVLEVLGVPYRRPVPITIENCSISSVEIRDGRNVVDALNDTCHLDEL